MTVTGSDIKRLREQTGMSQAELAQVLNTALGGERNYSSGSVSPWENDKRTIPASVSSLIEQLLLDAALPPSDQEPPDGPGENGDSAPRGDTPPSPQAPILSGGGANVRACTELWEMIATGVGMAGAATGNIALMNDGATIAADKDALGAAWGRLAETNETFRKMLLSMTEGSAWLQVALVTGTTLSKCYQQNHVTVSEPRLGGPVENDAAPLAAA